MAIRFRAMGTDVHVVVVGGPVGSDERARRRIVELEARWSRFLEGSEISRLNRHAGAEVQVSADTELLVRRALDGLRLSGGLVDPTVLGAVVRAGYDRSFEAIDPSTRPTSDLGLGADAIEVGDGWVRLGAGTGFDPGGIGKGLAADLVAAELLAGGATGVCVNVGGDLRVAGDGPSGEGWTLAVEHPAMPEPIAMLGVRDGAVATSTTLRRSWERDGARLHHLIDPATGEPSATDVTLATVVTGEAWTAEVLAKAVLLLGSADRFAVLDGLEAEAVAVDRAGAVHRTPGLGRFTGHDIVDP